MTFDLPTDLREGAAALENLLIARSTGDMNASNYDYEELRRDLIADPVLRDLLPGFVRTCRSLDVFWPYIKSQAGTYADQTPHHR